MAASLLCSACARPAGDLLASHCPSCGGMLRWRLGRLTLADIDRGAAGPWRYAAALPPLPSADRLWLGAGLTPLHQPAGTGEGAAGTDRGGGAGGGPGAWPALKLETLFPTGSYKERGASVLVSALAAAYPGRSLYDDSSGNAGAALAAYGRLAGLPVTVLTPPGTAPGKLALARALGATVEVVPGDRAAVAAAALARAEGAAGDPARPRYASHVRHPLFVAGCATALLEIWEQRGGTLPEELYVACGYGSQVLGAISALEALDALDGRCAVVAVQSRAYPAVWEAWRDGRAVTTPARRGTTVAEGIACADPPRGAEVLAGVRASGGRVLAVDDGEVGSALRALAGVGQVVEPTGAVALAGWRQERSGRRGERAPAPAGAVVVLSGSGLKTLPETIEAGGLVGGRASGAPPVTGGT